MLSCSAFVLMTALAGEHNADKNDIFSHNKHLVRVRALSVTFDGPYIRCIFAIEHAYLGEDSLRGKCFEACEQRDGSEMSYPLIKKGEVSIWWTTDFALNKKPGARKTQAEKNHRVATALDNPQTWHQGVYCCARKGVDAEHEKDYKKAEQRALAMESAYRARGKERIELLKEFCCKDDRVLQEWSLDRLKRALSKMDYVAYLKQLTSTVSLSLLMEHVVDCDLIKLSPSWRVSETRLKFFQRWMSGKLSARREDFDEHDIKYILARTNYDGFPYSTYYRLMIDGLTTARRSDAFKQYLLKTPDYCPKKLTDVDAGFAYLLSEMCEAAPDRQLAASRLLIHFVPLCEVQETAVRKFLDDLKCKLIVPHLTFALKQTAVVRDGLAGNDGPKVQIMKDGEKSDGFLWAKLLQRALEPQAVRFIHEYVRPSLAVDPARVQKIAADLDNDSFSQREAASRDLARMGLEAEPILHAMLLQDNSVESKIRLINLVEQFKKERIVTLRSIEVLAKINIPEARELLEKLADGTPQSQITREARKVLAAKRPARK